jgi:hypothetical protein
LELVSHVHQIHDIVVYIPLDKERFEALDAIVNKQLKPFFDGEKVYMGAFGIKAQMDQLKKEEDKDLQHYR